MYDLKIKGGTIVDGTGTTGVSGDVGIVDGVVVAVGDCPDAADRTIDADGALVIPGFTDVHTHYDGQISWDEELLPSAAHGVTTCVMGSCRVGFAPVRATDRDTLVELMEGVEDIPGSALSEGITWNWESFPEYMDALDRMPHTIDSLAQVPHDALRGLLFGQLAPGRNAAVPTRRAAQLRTELPRVLRVRGQRQEAGRAQRGRAGLVGIDEPLTLDMFEYDPDRVAAILAAQVPRWRPGTDQGYHGVTYGLYAGELLRRIAGESIGAFIAREIAEPLGAAFHIGLPPEATPRVARLYPASTAERLFKVIPKLFFHRGTEGRVYRNVALGGDTARAFQNPRELGPRGVHNFNSQRVHRLELPWGNGIASARGLCRIYSALANAGSIDGVRLVDASAIEPVQPRQTWSERDRVLCKPLGWSQGFLKEQRVLFSPNPESFGHAGAGGSLGWCDPVEKLAIGYVMNRMDHRIRSPRALRLCNAIYACL